MDEIKQIVKQYCEQKKLIQTGEKVLLCVSGGGDSVALFHLFLSMAKEYRLQLGVFHLNHMLRPESTEEERFVKELAFEANIPFHGYREDVAEISRTTGENQEAAGRRVRYRLIGQLMEQEGYRKSATAHHLNDSAESVLMNLTRGCSLQGLTGIDPITPKGIIRPLLCLTREDITNYLHMNGYPYATDLSNYDTSYTRNRLRHQVLTQLEEMNPGVYTHIGQLSQLACETEDFLLLEAEKLSLKREGDRISLSCSSLARSHPAVRRRTLLLMAEKLGYRRDISFSHIQSVLCLLNQPQKTTWDLSFPHGLLFFRRYDTLYLGKANEESLTGNPFCYPVSAQGHFLFPREGFCLHMEKVWDFQIKQNNPYVKYIDCDKIEGRLTVRSRKSGDSFHPFGMQGSKSVKKYMIDEKIPKEKRDRIPILADGKGIIWIMGCALSEQYKISSTTKNTLKLSYEQWRKQ